MGIAAGAGEGGRAESVWAVSCQREQQAFGTSWQSGGWAGKGWFVWDPAANLVGNPHCRYCLLETGRHRGFSNISQLQTVSGGLSSGENIPGGHWDWANSAFLGGEPGLCEEDTSQGYPPYPAQPTQFPAGCDVMDSALCIC